MKNISFTFANINDAKDMLDFLKSIHSENLPTLFKRDYLPSLQEEENYIRSIIDSNGVIISAKTNSKIIGLLTAARYINKQLNHSIMIGISVLKEYRNQGIGTILLQMITDWAKNNGVRRIELEVFSNNPKAVKLYKNTGFIIEGIKKRAVKIDDKFYDIILMAKYIRD